MMPTPTRLHVLTATEIVRGISDARFTAEDVVRSCLERIAERDGQVQAWTALDPDAALRQARVLDRQVIRGPLHGVPFGVKDVIETAQFPTEMGSALYAGHRSAFDASCVALGRHAGGVLLGKTATAEFAGITPPATRNPLDLLRTPGGSSSGSGAAVADGMVPVAFGTQTGGSVLRPAAYCGVVGFKPTFGSYNPAGMKAAAFSFDTLGLIARCVQDVALFHDVLTGGQTQNLGTEREQFVPHIGVCRTHLWAECGEATKMAVEESARRLGKAGARVTEFHTPTGFDDLNEHRAVVNAYERARGLAAEWFQEGGRLSAPMQALCEKGFAITRDSYVRALRFIERQRLEMDACLTQVDILLTPATAQAAPQGIAYAGDPRFQELWTLLHVPALTLPAHRDPDDMPVGVQLVARRYEEARLLAAARWLEAQLPVSPPSA